jgi:hypothetical protein
VCGAGRGEYYFALLKVLVPSLLRGSLMPGISLESGYHLPPAAVAALISFAAVPLWNIRDFLLQDPHSNY